MAIPGEIQNLNGVPRALLRESMRGVLPERIRTRTGKADFSYIINRGVAKDVRAISQALSSESLGVQLGYLDAARLAPALKRLSTDLSGPDCLNSWDLADVFGLEVWLQVFLKARAGGAVPISRQRRENVG